MQHRQGMTAGRLTGIAWMLLLALALALSGCGSDTDGVRMSSEPQPPRPAPPPQATGLVAEAGDGEVVLSWTALASAGWWEYRVRADGDLWRGWHHIDGSGPGTTGYTATGLRNGTTYHFQVRAENTGGPGPWSAEVAATPAPPAPPAPQAAPELFAAAGDHAVHLSWSVVAGASGWEYRVRAGDGARGGWTAVHGSGPETTAHTVAGLENGTAYGLQVRATNAGGAGPASAEAVATPARGVPVAIPDPNLRRVLEQALGKAAGAEITDAEMRALTELSGDSKRIEDLTGLEHATRLESLSLVSLSGYGRGAATGRIVDLAPLASLARLTSLDLQGNAVSDLAPLAALTSLVHLDLGHNGAVSDLRPLAGLSALAHLGLRYNSVSDVSPLAGLASLRTLDLNFNNVRDFASLAGLQGLVELHLFGNRADLSPLAVLTSLEDLDVGYTGVVDVRPLAGLGSLTRLGLHGNRIEDVSPLGGLAALESLDLTGTDLVDAGPLAPLTSMRYLFLGHSEVEDVSFVAGMSELFRLRLGGTKVADLRPLAALGRLESLDLTGTAVDDLSPLAGLGFLKELDIGGLSVDLAPLSGVVSLRVLRQKVPYVAELPMLDIAPLAGLTNLRELRVSPSRGDLSPLADLRSLTRLELEAPGTPFENVRVVGRMSGLVELKLPRGGLAEMPPLAESAVLRELELPGNRIDDLSPLAGQESLRRLDLDDNRVSDLAPLAANPGLGAGDTVSLLGNPLGPEALLTHIPALEARGATVAYDRDVFPDSPLRVLHDEAVSMVVEEDLATVQDLDLDLPAYVAEFLAHFGDGFDVLLFLSALDEFEDHAGPGYSGVYYSVSNNVGGIGLGEYRDPDLPPRLKGVIHFPWRKALSEGPSLHELMHAWANYGVPTVWPYHWGFSSADGQLGGFRLENLVDLGGGRWSAGNFDLVGRPLSTDGRTQLFNDVPYSPWELYLGGFVGPEEVPDLWYAPEGRFTGERTEEGYRVFEAEHPATLTVDEFIGMHGPREPHHADAPKTLRGAVIVLEDDRWRMRRWEELLADVRWLARPRSGNRRDYNFHEATGGRGRLFLDGLRERRRETPFAVAELHLEQVCPPPGAPPLSPVSWLTGRRAAAARPAEGYDRGAYAEPGEREIGE